MDDYRNRLVYGWIEKQMDGFIEKQLNRQKMDREID